MFTCTTFPVDTICAQHTIIPANSVWRYDDTGVDLDALWRDAAYDDTGWSSGPGILGYGEAYITTTVSYGPDSLDKYRTTYFRIDFDVTDDPADITSVRLHPNVDDGFVAYLNGVEATRQSMPAGAITYDTFASPHEGGRYESIDLGASIGDLVMGANVLAVEVHQASATSSDLVWDAWLETSTLPVKVTRGPYLQVGTPAGVTVRWRTASITDSYVRYGPAPGSLGSVESDATMTTEHEITLSGLSPDTRYYYSIGTADFVLAGDDPAHFFVTSPLAGTARPTRIWVVGDSGLPGPGQIAVRNAYYAFPGAPSTDLWLMLGDNAGNTGTDSEYQKGVFDAYQKMLCTSVLWPTRGNHDHLYTGPDNDYYDFFTMPTAAEAGGLASGTEAYYSFDYGNIHFICLDAEGSDRSPDGAQMTWLQNDLDANVQDWIIAFWHQPPYTKGSHDSDTEFELREMRKYALPILEGGGVDLVLCGHSHSYERSFLLDRHYGLSSMLDDSNMVDTGDGSWLGDGPYHKPTLGPGSHEGAVYAVVGCSSVIRGGPLNHPVMIRSLNMLGSLVLDIDGNQLDATFLDDAGVIQDDFSIVKGDMAKGTVVKNGTAAVSVDPGPGQERVSLLTGPNPFVNGTRLTYTVPRAGHVRLEVYDAGGRRLVALVDEEQAAGRRVVYWNGRDARGTGLSPGVYFSRLVIGEEVRTEKILFVR